MSVDLSLVPDEDLRTELLARADAGCVLTIQDRHDGPATSTVSMRMKGSSHWVLGLLVDAAGQVQADLARERSETA